MRVLTDTVGEEQTVFSHVPAMVFMVCVLNLHVRQLWEGGREH